MNWTHLDVQMKEYSAMMVGQVKLNYETTEKLASIIDAEIKFLTTEQKAEILSISPVPPQDRLAELVAFQGWMDQSHIFRSNPFISRAQVLSQSYICFVYLPESCFRILAKVCLKGTATRKCAQFLSDNPVRAFRNAIVHANWKYRSDFEAIVYWAKKGNEITEPLEKFEVEQRDLEFWQALSRCLAYVVFTNLVNG